MHEGIKSHDEGYEIIESPETEGVERTLLMIKPDAIEKDLVAEIFKFIEETGLEIEEQFERVLTEEIIYKFWPKIYGQDWIERSIAYLTSRPVIVCVLSGKGAIETMLSCKRNLRSQYPNDDPVVTVIHASDSAEEFSREYSVLFGGDQ